MPALVQVTNSAQGGGLERCVQWLAEEAVARGWESTVAYWRGEAPASPACHVRLPLGATPLRWATALAALVRRDGPDIVHVHGSAPGSVGAAAARLAGCSGLVFSSHELHHTMPTVERAARRAAARLPAVTIAPSRATIDSLVRGGVPVDRVRLIRYATPAVSPLREPDVTPQATRRFVYVANMWPWKGHSVLLRALALLPPKPPVEAVLVGDGTGRARLEEEAGLLGLGRSVRFAGSLADPWSIAEGAWAYLHPSQRETGPIAVLEAMMRGLPVIAAAAGGTPEVVVPGRTGILVPPDDAPALAHAIGGLIADRPARDRLARAARAYALAEHTLSRWLDTYFAVYGEVRSRPSTRFQ